MKTNLFETLKAGLGNGLKCQLIHDLREEFECEDFVTDIEQFNKGAIWTYAGWADEDLSLPMGEGDFSGALIRNKFMYSSVGNSVKPMLFDLSDLVNEITINGKTFTPMNVISSKFEMNVVEHNFIEQNCDWKLFDWKQVRWCVIEWLIENHFNVFKILPDQFIRVTPENSPYK